MLKTKFLKIVLSSHQMVHSCSSFYIIEVYIRYYKMGFSYTSSSTWLLLKEYRNSDKRQTSVFNYDFFSSFSLSRLCLYLASFLTLFILYTLCSFYEILRKLCFHCWKSSLLFLFVMKVKNFLSFLITCHNIWWIICSQQKNKEE